MQIASTAFKSKTLAALLAFLFGTLGAHRFYLHGRRDPFAYLHFFASCAGVAGALLLLRSTASGIGWVCAIAGGISLTAAFLTAIVYGLRPDDKWDRRFNAQNGRHNHSRWGAIFVVIFSLFVGTSLLMGGLAFAFQTYFESHPTANDINN
ncbi:MAG: NINE protein [Janthinobacterium lividum]